MNKKDLKKKLVSCQKSIEQVRAQKRALEEDTRAAEAEFKENKDKALAAALQKKVDDLHKHLKDLSEGCEEMEKELESHQRDLLSMIPDEMVQMDNATLNKLAVLLSKQPGSTDEMMDKFSEIYSHQRKSDIPCYDGIVSEEKPIEDWFREAERVARTAGWNDEQKLRLFSDRLSKMALRFHVELLQQTPDISYQDWKREMKKGFKNDAEIERRKKQLTNLKQTTSHRVREFILLIDEQYLRAYGKTLAESKDPDIALLRDNTKKDIVYKGLLPPLAEELWHRTSARTTYAELIKLAGEVEEILNRKALLRPETIFKINHIAADSTESHSTGDFLDEEFDGLTIDELNSSSHIESSSAHENLSDLSTYEPVIRWMRKEPKTQGHYYQEAGMLLGCVNGLWRNPTNYRSEPKLDLFESQGNRPDYARRSRPSYQEERSSENGRSRPSKWYDDPASE